MRVRASTYDPENLFQNRPPQTGIIERRLMEKRMETDKKFAAAVLATKDEDKKKAMLRRESRTPPEDHVELVEFFLNTPAEDMEVRPEGTGLVLSGFTVPLWTI
jgi:hypothetical protein